MDELAEAKARIAELETLLKRCQDEAADIWGQLVSKVEAEAKARIEFLEDSLEAAVRNGQTLSAEMASLRAAVCRQEERRQEEVASLRAELAKEILHAKFASDEHGKADAECESLRAEVKRLREKLNLTEARLLEALNDQRI
jgi:septation ring formation regulator EzrA